MHEQKLDTAEAPTTALSTTAAVEAEILFRQSELQVLLRRHLLHPAKKMTQKILRKIMIKKVLPLLNPQ